MRVRTISELSCTEVIPQPIFLYLQDLAWSLQCVIESIKASLSPSYLALSHPVI